MAGGSFGGSIKLTGESDYRRAIQSITADLGRMSNALSAQARDIASQGKAASSSAANQKTLADAIAQQKTKIDQAKNALAQYQTQLTAQQTRHGQLTKEYKSAVLELDRIKKTSGETSDEYKKQAKTVSDLGQKLSASNREMGDSRTVMSKLKNEISTAEKTINQATDSVDDLGKETEDAGKSAKTAGDGYTVFKGILADLSSRAIMAAVDGIKNLGSAIVSVGKQAFDSYANYEQLSGGIETLYKNSAATVEQYAANAYKTAGMSANQYLDTATSFAATLINGLGGDTATAAKYADMAISDMADNANKMGTSIDSIRQTYQSLARGDVVMLANLKLGYGGTAAELARLVNDSGVLADAAQVTATTVKNVPFDQIIEAIHVTQQALGVTGATAAEAESTIQGSLGSMQAAWQNMLTGLASGSHDINALATQLIGSVQTFAQNMIPVIGQIASSFTQLIAASLNSNSQVNAGLKSLFNSILTALPGLTELVTIAAVAVLNAAPKILEALANGILQALPSVLPALSTSIIPRLVESLLSMLPLLLDAGLQILVALVDGISTATPQLLNQLPIIIGKLVDVLSKNAPRIAQSGWTLLIALVDGILKALPQLINQIPIIVTRMTQNFGKGTDQMVRAGVALLISLVKNMPAILVAVNKAIPQIVLSLAGMIKNNTGLIVNAGVGLFLGLIQQIPVEKIVGAIPGIVSKIAQKFKDLVGQMVSAGGDLIGGLWRGIWDAMGGLVQKVRNAASRVVDTVKGVFGIASPSKVFRYEIGQNLAESLGMGFTGEMAGVRKQIEQSIPTSFDLDAPKLIAAPGTAATSPGGIGSGATLEAAVTLLKTALAQVKIELDGEQAGKFVDQTISKAIYT